MTAPAAPAAEGRGGLLRRWPTAAGIVLGAGLIALLATGRADAVDLVAVLTAAGLVYLGSAALKRRGAAWPLFGVTFVLITIGLLASRTNPTWWMLGLALILLVVGLVLRALRPAWGLPLQAAAMAVVIAVALVVAHLAPPWGALLAGAGLLAHAAWDIHHHRTERVVPRSLSEFCAVLDTVLGLALIATAFIR